MSSSIELSETLIWHVRNATVRLVTNYLAARSNEYPALAHMLRPEEREIQECIGYWTFSELDCTTIEHVLAVIRELMANLPSEIRTWNPNAESIVRPELKDLESKLVARIEQLRHV